jgi:hypothetical protein
MSAPKRTLEPVPDTPTTCPGPLPLQPSCCLTACTDPYIRLASACLWMQLTRPFRYRRRRRARIPEQPSSSRIRHEDRKSVFAISTRILQRPQVETSSPAKNTRNLQRGSRPLGLLPLPLGGGWVLHADRLKHAGDREVVDVVSGGARQRSSLSPPRRVGVDEPWVAGMHASAPSPNRSVTPGRYPSMTTSA